MKLITTIICFLLLSAGSLFAEFEMSAGSENKCLDCHQRSFASQNKHFVENSEDCQFCHEATFDGTAHNVSTFVSNTICESCHFDIDNGTKLLKHDYFNCVSCHDPHGSDYEYSMLTNSVAFCFESCHNEDQLGLSHPVGDGIKDKHAGGELTCISTCHTNHKPADEKLLQLASNDLCSQCHQEKY